MACNTSSLAFKTSRQRCCKYYYYRYRRRRAAAARAAAADRQPLNSCSAAQAHASHFNSHSLEKSHIYTQCRQRFGRLQFRTLPTPSQRKRLRKQQPPHCVAHFAAQPSKSYPSSPRSMTAVASRSSLVEPPRYRLNLQKLLRKVQGFRVSKNATLVVPLCPKCLPRERGQTP